MRRNKILIYWLAGLILALGLIFIIYKINYRDKELYRETRLAMGTLVEVASTNRRSQKIVFKEFNRLEKLLSKFDSSSEISQLNKKGYLKASPETFYVIKRSLEFWRETGGAFDITVEPLVQLWGFTDKRQRIPTKKQISETLKLVGSDKIILHDKDNVIQFMLPGMKIDLGAIAKGYALDCAAAKLRQAGIKSCLINAGGQVYCLGGYLGEPWKIGIIDPLNDNLIGYLWLTDKSASTSGNYRQYFRKGKKLYGHILDPRSGYPVNSNFTSVTVTAKSALTADALSTSVFVLGEKEGRPLETKFKDVSISVIEYKHAQNN